MSPQADQSVDGIEAGRHHRETFSQIPDWVALADIPPQALALYVRLFMHVNVERDDGVVWPGMDVLAKLMGYQRRQSLRPHLAALVDLGALDIRRTTGNGGRRNVYVVHAIPPEGYAGPRSLSQFYAQRREAQEDRMGATPPMRKDAIPTQRKGATATMNKTKTNQTKRTTRTSTASAAYDCASSGREKLRDEMKVHDHEVFDDPTEDDRGHVEQQLMKSVMAAIPAHGHVRATDAREQLERAFRECRAQSVPVGALRGLVDRVLGEITSGSGNGNVLVDHGPF